MIKDSVNPPDDEIRALEKRKRELKAMLIDNIRSEFWSAGDARRDMGWCHEYLVISGGKKWM